MSPYLLNKKMGVITFQKNIQNDLVSCRKKCPKSPLKKMAAQAMIFGECKDDVSGRMRTLWFCVLQMRQFCLTKLSIGKISLIGEPSAFLHIRRT